MKKKTKKLARVAVPGQAKQTKMGMSPSELKFVNAYKQYGSYSAACREAYPNVKHSNTYGYTVSIRPHVRAAIDKFKKELNDAVDDPWFIQNYVNIVENSLFKKIILKKRKISDGEVFEEEQEVDQTPVGLQALNGLAKFKKGNEQSLLNNGTINVSVVMDNRILNANEKKIMNDPSETSEKTQVIIDI